MKSDKKKLRREYAAARDNFSSDLRQAADEKITKIFLENYAGYQSFFVYVNFRSEVSTKAIIEGLLKAGKRVYCPKVCGADMLRVPYGGMKTGAYGISEPVGKPYTGKIDVCVTPLLAVDGQGFRLGYGAGFYDRYFAANDIIKVGLGYGFQVTSADFCDESDIPLNCFICERGIINYG